jgi:hypothetical protein
MWTHILFINLEIFLEKFCLGSIISFSGVLKTGHAEKHKLKQWLKFQPRVSAISFEHMANLLSYISPKQCQIHHALWL